MHAFARELLVEERQQVYVMLFMRTFWLSLVITATTFLLGFPIAHLLATLPMRKSNLLMILVLLPFWTSLLVRTTAWMVLLQQQGVVNDILVWLGVVGQDGRLQLIYNQIGTIIAMTHILLPFMILPIQAALERMPDQAPDQPPCRIEPIADGMRVTARADCFRVTRTVAFVRATAWTTAAEEPVATAAGGDRCGDR